MIATPEKTVMTDGHYANAWERRPKVINPGHLAILGVVGHMIGYQRKTTTVAREMKAITEGQFANIPATVMLHLVGGLHKSTGITPATQVQDQGQDTVIQGGGIVMDTVVTGQGHHNQGCITVPVQNLIVYQRMKITQESTVIQGGSQRTNDMMDEPVGCHLSKSSTAIGKCTDGLIMNAVIT
ncbi:hypothetical protein DPMN_046358 [Dreissena polymorpha]|uniref:Uncharacterized protein n=1 Tax=Dreissena polymorpha TaxID=45954 RepID=A0A9D4D9G7_DREPO|nr:hypothetical protein DPMN_046358 [Dreissena polymorpha]